MLSTAGFYLESCGIRLVEEVNNDLDPTREHIEINANPKYVRVPYEEKPGVRALVLPLKLERLQCLGVAYLLRQ